MSDKFEGFLSLGDELDSTEGWYSAIDETGGKWIETSNPAAAIGLSIALDRINSGKPLQFISEDRKVTVRGKQTPLREEDMQTFMESDTIPFDPDAWRTWNEQNRPNRIISALAAQARKYTDS